MDAQGLGESRHEVSGQRDRVFIWKGFGKWKPALENMFPDILTPELEAKARQNPQCVEDSEDHVGCKRLIRRPLDEVVTSDKIEEFRRLYSHIRVYHACRTVDVQSYHEKGILLLSRDEQIERFKHLFLRSEGFAELTEGMLEQSIQTVDSLKNDAEDELCLAIDDKYVIEKCGHYLIYGSEYLSNLVSQLPVGREKREKCRSALRRIGKPTFFEADLPNTREYASEDTLRDLLYDMIMTWVYNVAQSRMESGTLDFTFPIKKPLPPEHIRGCFHPPRIPDPHMRGRVYVTETGEYESDRAE